MEVLDAQLHCWHADRPSRPWTSGYRRRMAARNLNILIQSGVPMPPETLLLEMAAAGVDGGVLTPQGVYGTSNELELQTASDYPRRFAVVGWVDQQSPDVEERIAADVARGMLGVRLFADGAALDRGEYDRVLDACEQHGLAVAIWLPHPVPHALVTTISRYSGVRFMIDHLGLGHAPPAIPAGADPWARLSDVLGLARYENVSLKLTGAPSLSRQEYPYVDTWDGILRLVEAYGPERVMWGSDITRTGSLHRYVDAVTYLREIDGLGDAALRELYGGALRRILRWDPDAHLPGGRG